MGDSGVFRAPVLHPWQRTNVIAAANSLRQQISRTPEDQKVRAAYEGLLDLLDPSRVLARKQREMAQATRQAAAAIKTERRSQERRTTERRKGAPGTPNAGERRAAERRTKDRRSR